MMGDLYLCPTPIGNLDDMTFRVIKILKECHVICAEDTRRTKQLLTHFEIKNKLISYHEHNKFEKMDEIINMLIDGKMVALVSDAGTPAISDPGNELVKKCVELGINVVPLSGACACICAVIASGFDTRSFIFEGFLPKDKTDRKLVLERNITETRTLVFYEAPHRLIETLEVFYKSFGNRRICICKEISKIHEEFIHTNISSAIEMFKNTTIKGEYVIVIEGVDPTELVMQKQESYRQMDIKDHMKIYEDKGYTQKDAMKLVAKDRGQSKRDIYSMIKGGKNE